MKREAEIKELLISNTVNVIAEGGFEKATTKELTHYKEKSHDIKMNEAYIYRLFGSKENLYDSAFSHLDSELYEAFLDGIKFVGDFGNNLKEKLWEFFLLAWRFILGNERRCRCYVRYYYSIYFKGKALEAHRKLFQGVVAVVEPVFKEEADAFSIMHSVFITLFDFCIRVYNGDLEDNDLNRPHVFNVLYCMMSAYFKDELKAS